MTAKGNFQPFNALGNVHQIARLKRLLNTLSGHFVSRGKGRHFSNWRFDKKQSLAKKPAEAGF
jgi:hypothetical protein